MEAVDPRAEPFDIRPMNLSGRAVILVHGFLAGSNTFNGIEDDLVRQGFRVRAVLLPGHGIHPQYLRDIKIATMRSYLEKEIASLREQGCEDITLIGHSMGGALGLLISDKVDRLILAAPFFRIAQPEWLRIELASLVNAFSWLPSVWMGRHTKSVSVASLRKKIFRFSWVPMRFLRELIELGQRVSKAEFLAGVACPVLVIQGYVDRAVSIDDCRVLIRNLPDFRFEVLPRSDHHIFWDLDKERVSEVICEFLDQG